MKHRATTFFLTGLLLAASGAAIAAPSFFVVTPAPGKGPGRSADLDIAVTLNAASLPAARIKKLYSFDFDPLVRVTGDPDFDQTKVAFSVEGGVPEGLALAGSVLTGTPVAKVTGSSFNVVASYKDKQGRQVYTLDVESSRFSAVAVAGGANHTCAITPQGSLYCWGANTVGQLGLGHNAPVMMELPAVPGLTSGVTAVASGNQNTCVVQSGAVKCWGPGDTGAVGSGVLEDRWAPTQVVGLTSGVTDVAVGFDHACAIQAGALKCWGGNQRGQLGNGEIVASQSTPVDVQGMSDGVTAVVAGQLWTCAIQYGAAKCWGFNTYGSLGTGLTQSLTVPGQVAGLESGTTQLSGKGESACAVHNGSVKCWGRNERGQVGDGTRVVRRAPVAVADLSANVSQLSVGGAFACAIQSGDLRCWGTGPVASTLTPTNVLLTGVTSVGSGGNHACVTQSGDLLCWGANTMGQLGDGTLSNSTVPAHVMH